MDEHAHVRKKNTRSRNEEGPGRDENEEDLPKTQVRSAKETKKAISMETKNDTSKWQETRSS